MKALWGGIGAQREAVDGGGAGARGPFYGVAEGAKVTITDAAFDPAEVTVTAGYAVSWKNAGQGVHTVTAEDGSFDSGPRNPGQEWSHPFSKEGTFTYKCSQNPAMKGIVKVTPSKDPSPH